jgi:hypothetical protein
MTTRKADLPLRERPSAYVNREGGAAELTISPETWDRWVVEGILPPPAPGFPFSTPRWRWADVDAKLRAPDQRQTTDAFMVGAGRLRDGAPTNGKHRPS